MGLSFNIITLFPDYFNIPLSQGVISRAMKRGLVQVKFYNPRDYTCDTHKSVDDKPFGGFDGMLLKVGPLGDLVEDLKNQGHMGKLVYLSPQGKVWNDSLAREWALSSIPITLLCGRYSGVDQRFLNTYVDEEVSIGDFVLSGGEIAATVILDSVFRFLPGTLGNELSKDEESFSRGLLEAPQFTRPRTAFGQDVPDVLLSGDHQKINQFQLYLSLLVTLEKRPELITKAHIQELNKAMGYLAGMQPSEVHACGLDMEVLKNHWSKIFKS